MAGTHYVETGLFWVDSLGNIIDLDNIIYSLLMAHHVNI